LKEIRQEGNYISSPVNPDLHSECGGDQGTVVFFSIRGNSNDDILYELLDDQQKLIGTITMQDPIDLHEANK
jgi:hypothetical protein